MIIEEIGAENGDPIDSITFENKTDDNSSEGDGFLLWLSFSVISALALLVLNLRVHKKSR